MLLPNPIVLQRADPFVLRTDSGYLFTGSYPAYDRIVLRRADRLADLQSAEEHTIWRHHETGPMSRLIWAPEIHRINGRWVIYFAAAPTMELSPDGHTFQHRVFCLTCDDEDPIAGTWTERGQVDTGMETFALDATTFVSTDGRQYLVWAQQDLAIEGNSNLYIARMANPWTLDGPATRLSSPEYDWERVRFTVEEGPAILVHDGTVFVTFSASGTGPEYAMGMLTAPLADDDRPTDLLDSGVWTKLPEPIFVSDESVRQFGPGHNSFTVDADGNDLLVYHCRNYVEILGDPLFDPNRHARVGRIRWTENGMPDFGTPLQDTRWTPATCDVLPPDGKLVVDETV
ncbi:glycoside hydrolase family 43 protein [Bifidobacterium choloepi]|uniref:Family 43 glycosylhydrolase n=1 Tax=Bifidobacterium choloepi TaxID=2614131 RepID=A0A6I5N0W3_9BIFI|nr:family 43 glycosylhydrolase [Bifidobacterium choloepi]NEG70568.1 family 43 glycosylhydrolase [Bifidobacterium choloepi]